MSDDVVVHGSDAITPVVSGAAVASPEKTEGLGAIDFIKETIEWFATFSQIKSYFRTRRAVVEKEDLFDFSEEQLRAAGFMTPLRFNACQTILSAAPTYALLWFLSFLRPKPGPVEQPIGSSAFQITFSAVLPEVMTKVRDVTEPLIQPLIILLSTWILGWAVLRKEDLSRTNRMRLGRAHMFFDGAYGLYPEAVLIFVITVIMPIFPGAPIWYVYSLYGLLYRLQAPRTIFDIFGYRDPSDMGERVITIFSPQPDKDPPKWKYWFIGVIGLTISCVILNLLLIVGQVLIGTAIAAVGAVLRVHLGGS